MKDDHANSLNDGRNEQSEDIEKPLTADEFDQLEEFLFSSLILGALSLEEVDGYFASLLVGPDNFHYAEGVTGALGGDSIEMVRQHNVDDLHPALVLLGRHWHSMKKGLELGSPQIPVLRDCSDACVGRDWAHGFMRGVSTTAESWDSLRRDPEASAWLQSLQLLEAEDAGLTSDSNRLSASQRMELIADIPNLLLRFHRYFFSRRAAHFRKDLVTEDFERHSTNPCPCGSGLDYRRCCGSGTIH
jgi:uncharacterized protein